MQMGGGQGESALSVSGGWRAENGLWEGKQWVPAQERHGHPDRQTCMHAYSSPPGAFVTLLTKRKELFPWGHKASERVDGPLLIGSGRLKQNPSTPKQELGGTMKGV